MVLARNRGHLGSGLTWVLLFTFLNIVQQPRNKCEVVLTTELCGHVQIDSCARCIIFLATGPNQTCSTQIGLVGFVRRCLHHLREQRSEEISSQSLGSLVNPENADERKEVVLASRNRSNPTQIQKSDILKRVDNKHPGNCERIKKSNRKC